MLRKHAASLFGGATAPYSPKFSKASRQDKAMRAFIAVVVAIVITGGIVYWTAPADLQPPPRRTREAGDRPVFEEPPLVAAVPSPAQSTKVLKALSYTPVVVLSTGEGKWNTGVWPGYGPKVSTLNWAAAGVVVNKTSCPYQCEFTDDQTKIPTAQVVLMEVINHPKFLGDNTNIPIPWPEKRTLPNGSQLPLFGNFYFEPSTGTYANYITGPEVKSKMDFVVGPDVQSVDIPITLVCPWGRPVSAYLNPPPAKLPGRLIAMFNEHGYPPEYSEYVRALLRILGEDLHSFLNYKNKDTPPEAGGNPYQLSTRLDFTGTYKFVLITESVVLNDYIEPNWSQAFLAGVVPVYIGAPNIREYAPGPNSFVDIRDYNNPADLVAKLKALDADEEQYKRFFEWKAKGLSDSFQTALDRCVHYAECRICAWARKKLTEMEA